tara:strand:+ start:1891 stop:3213 length:1323 start_codon:yes stop_codon:yes gene_type:complete
MAISHRTNRLKLKGSPSVEKLQNDRYKLTITCSTMNSREDWYSANKARVFPDFGSLESAEMSIDGLSPRTGETYPDMRLTEVQSGNRSPRDGEDYIVVLTYETLGDSFVQVKDDTVTYTENGLRRVTRESIAKAGTDFQKTVGTTSITSQIDGETAVTCFLSSYEIDDTDSYREVTEIYVEPGEIQTSTKPGRIDGTTEVTIVSTGTAVVPSGELILSSQTEKQGYSTFTRTAIQGTIEGTKQTYKDVVQVDVPGEVKCTTIDVESGGVSGTIAVPEVTPRRRKTIAAQVTVEVTNTPPDTASVAFDLGAISCSVTSTNVSLSRSPGNEVTTASGTLTSRGFSQSFGASARIQTYPGCFLTTESSTGEISYIASQVKKLSSGGNIITSENTFSNRQTKCVGTGSTTSSGYSETGIIKRNSRPIVTALDGTTYYEVVTWSV